MAISLQSSLHLPQATASEWSRVCVGRSRLCPGGQAGQAAEFLMGRAVSLQRGFRQAGRGGRAALEAGSPGNGGFLHCTHHLQTPAYMYHRPQTHTIERAIKMHMMYAHSYIRSHIHSPVSPATCTLCSTHPYMYTTYTYHRIQRTCLCKHT